MVALKPAAASQRSEMNQRILPARSSWTIAAGGRLSFSLLPPL
jgi:hypothetical protein